MNRDALIAEDLIWIWNCAEGELSAPSNYMAMVNAIRLGRRPGSGNSPTEMDPRRFAAATRMRLISKALRRLRATEYSVLFAVFGPHAGELPILEKAAPVAIYTKAARAAHQASGTTRSIDDWLLRLVHRASNRLGNHLAEDRVTAQAIATEANGMLAQAMRAYSMAWRLGRDQMPTEAKAKPPRPAQSVLVPGGPSAPARANKTAMGESPRIGGGTVPKND